MMDTGCIAELIIEIWQHKFKDHWIQRGCGLVIQINWFGHYLEIRWITPRITNRRLQTIYGLISVF